MRVAQILRRSVAVVSATALVSAGGVVSGALTGTALAADYTLTSVSPSFAVNNTTKSITVTTGGADFYPTSPSNQVAVTLRHNPVIAGLADIEGDEADNSAGCTTGGISSPGAPNSDCGQTLTFTADLRNAAPGSYDVVVVSTGVGPGSTTNTYTAPGGFSVAATGNPTVSDSSVFAGADTPPDGYLQITGTNLANGSSVEFLTGSASGAPDAGITFNPTYDGTTGYTTDSTVLKGKLTLGSFTEGPHYIRVTNANGESGTSAQPFYQPEITAGTPAQYGQGSTSAPLVLTGDFSPSSSVFIKESDSGSAAAGITIGTVTVSADRHTLSTTVTVDPDTATGSRDLTVRSDNSGTTNGGGFYKVANGMLITVSPKITSVSPTNRGQGYAGDVTVNGSDLKTTTAFDFGSGITATTTSAASNGSSAVVGLVIAPDAGLGARSVRATNADHGTTTGGTFTVNAKPVVDFITPGSALRGQSKAVTLTGHDFVSGATLSATPAGLTITNVTRTSATQLTATFAVASDVPSSVTAFDIKVTNPDGGTSTCADCFGLNNLEVSPAAVSNSQAWTITVKAPALTANSVVKVSLPSATDQGELTGSFVSYSAGTGLRVSVDFTKAAAGSYTVTATEGGTTYTCVGCLQVAAVQAPANLTVTPATGGAGAVDRVITITGDGLSRGQTVSFGAGVTTVSTTYQATSPDALRVVISIASDATPGARDVTVTNVGEPTTKGTKAGGFTVTAAPQTSSLSPTAIGQGGTNDVTLTGTGYQEGVTADFGPGTSATLKTYSATAPVFTVIVSSVAPTTTRGVTVTNPDGGRSTKDAAFTVTPKPTLTSVTPSSIHPGASATDATFLGSGFATGDTHPTVTIASVTVTVKSVSSDGTQLVADLSAASNAPAGSRVVTITNPDKGQSATAGKFAVSKWGTTLTSTRSVGTPTAQQTVTFSGKLTRTEGGTPVSGANVVLSLDPDLGSTRNISLTTNSSGVWSVAFRPTYNTVVVARYAGDADDAASVSPSSRMLVRPRITRTSPASGASSPATTTLAVKGYITPNKAGRTVYLYKGTSVIGRAVVASNGTFVIDVRLARGSHTLRIYMPTSPGNTSGTSASFIVKRT